jgi:hypothetical protein
MLENAKTRFLQKFVPAKVALQSRGDDGIVDFTDGRHGNLALQQASVTMGTGTACDKPAASRLPVF